MNFYLRKMQASCCSSTAVDKVLRTEGFGPSSGLSIDIFGFQIVFYQLNYVLGGPLEDFNLRQSMLPRLMRSYLLLSPTSVLAHTEPMVSVHITSSGHVIFFVSLS